MQNGEHLSRLRNVETQGDERKEDAWSCVLVLRVAVRKRQLCFPKASASKHDLFFHKERCPRPTYGPSCLQNCCCQVDVVLVQPAPSLELEVLTYPWIQLRRELPSSDGVHWRVVQCFLSGLFSYCRHRLETRPTAVIKMNPDDRFRQPVPI